MLEYWEMKQNTVKSLLHWTFGQDRASKCLTLVTLIFTDVDCDNAGHYIRELQRARECAGLPIACSHMEVRHGSD